VTVARPGTRKTFVVQIYADGAATVENLRTREPTPTAVPATAHEAGEVQTDGGSAFSYPARPWSSAHGGSMSITAVTDLLEPGRHVFALRCVEVDPDIEWSRPSLAAVMMGGE
jgi:hypothetical protein